MKRIILFCLLNFIIFGLPKMFGQIPFPTEDGIWEEEFWGIAGVPIPVYNAICGDTLIGGVEYSKVIQFSCDFDGNVVDTSYRAAIRIEDDEVWAFFQYNNEETLLYDFGLTVGESITLSTEFGVDANMTVAEIGSISINGQDHKLITFEEVDFTTEHWIEGVGSSRGLFARGVIQVSDYDPYLNCFHNEDYLYVRADYEGPCTFSYDADCSGINYVAPNTAEEAITMYPNPATDFVHIRNDSNRAVTLQIFSIAGKLLNVQAVNNQAQAINIEFLKPGAYVFVLRENTSAMQIFKKIIIN